MYGWNSGGTRRRPEGTADADNPSVKTIQSRRESDIRFLEWVRAASHDELADALEHAKGWRHVAISRMLCKSTTNWGKTGS